MLGKRIRRPDTENCDKADDGESEMWILSKVDIKKLQIWEREMLRLIWGEIEIGENCKRRTNLELEQIYREPRISTIQRRVENKQQKKYGKPPVFTELEELELSEYLALSAKWRTRYTVDEDRFVKNLSGEKWVKSYLQRQNRAIKSRMSTREKETVVNPKIKKINVTPDNSVAGEAFIEELKQAQKRRNESIKHFIGKVIEEDKERETLKITSWKNHRGSPNTFVFPDVEDCDEV
ncbi:hypothetical protein ILUMI_26196 [Ignelater luminosus]|uniref:Uncharacterized protein n=1 Tax=Ignelater luminosus TaxID=2038154 RepID=A0A8K0C713_IGNLU|nr:hypothetical protein ILUMI_26196 [Ignelater luminosus]